MTDAHHAEQRLIALREVEVELRDCRAALAAKDAELTQVNERFGKLVLDASKQLNAKDAEVQSWREANECARDLLDKANAEIGRRTTERNYHMRVADQLAARIRELDAELDLARKDAAAGWKEVMELTGALAQMREALATIIEAEDEFRGQLPKDWDGDPLYDAINAARSMLTAGEREVECTKCGASVQFGACCECGQPTDH